MFNAISNDTKTELITARALIADPQHKRVTSEDITKESVVEK
jgi:hypothetical protein